MWNPILSRLYFGDELEIVMCNCINKLLFISITDQYINTLKLRESLILEPREKAAKVMFIDC